MAGCIEVIDGSNVEAIFDGAGSALLGAEQERQGAVRT